MVSERSGVVNIALEGMMLMGCFFGIWGSDTTGSWVLGLLIAMGVGGLTAFIYAIFAIHLRADQIVGGTAINFLALGITGYLFIADLRAERHARPLERRVDSRRPPELPRQRLLRRGLRPAQPDDLARRSC